MLRLPILSLLFFALLGFATACSDDDDIGASENATETAADTTPSPKATVANATPAPPPPPPDAPPPPPTTTNEPPPPTNEPPPRAGPAIVTIEEPPNNSGGKPNLPVQLKGSAVYSAEGFIPSDPFIEWRVNYAGLSTSIGEGLSITWIPSDYVTLDCGSGLVEIVLNVFYGGNLSGQDSIDYEVVSGLIC